MNHHDKDVPWINSNLFTDNVNSFPAEEYLKYAGQWIAWNLEGTLILAHDADPLEMAKNLMEQGIDASQVVEEYVATSDSTSHTGGILSE